MVTYRNQNRHDINEILLKVAFNNKKPTNQPTIEINDNISCHALLLIMNIIMCKGQGKNLHGIY